MIHTLIHIFLQQECSYDLIMKDVTIFKRLTGYIIENWELYD